MTTKILVKVAVLCSNSDGAPEFFTCTLTVSQSQYDNGDHYGLAKESAGKEGYEPHQAFDENDPAAKQLGFLHLFM